MTYRIVARFGTNDDPYYIVQQKRWYGWGCPSTRYSYRLYHYIEESYERFSTLHDAEQALEAYLKDINNAKRPSVVIKEYEK